MGRIKPMPNGKGRPGKHPNKLPEPSAKRFRDLLDGMYAVEPVAATVGAKIGVSGQAVTQILNGTTKQVSISTAEGIARALGKRLYIGISGEEPPEGVRTIGTDGRSAAALKEAAERYGLASWIVAELQRTPIPDGWPSLSPEVIHDLAAVWEKWEGRLGSGTRPTRKKTQRSR